tara:strand:- start:149 stop:364 length:216 start_codon:yes stop_codon:yes gene_type:complete
MVLGTAKQHVKKLPVLFQNRIVFRALLVVLAAFALIMEKQNNGYQPVIMMFQKIHVYYLVVLPTKNLHAIM